MECTLIRNGVQIKEYKTYYKYQFSFARLLVYVGLGIAFGVAMSYFHWSNWSFIGLVLLILIISLAGLPGNIIVEEIQT